MAKLIKISLILLLLANVFLIGALKVSAIEGILPDTESGQAPGAACQSSNCGNYTLNEMVSVATKIAGVILGLVGSLALLAFVAGGLMMMLSAGNPEWVTRGKQTLIGAVIGLTIVFTSYMIIQLVFASLGIPNPAGNLTWFTSGWFK